MTELELPHPFTSYSNRAAWDRFSDPDLLKAWKETPAKIRRVRHRGIQNSYSLHREARRTVPNRDSSQLARKIRLEITSKLKKGYLVAWGRDARPTGNWVRIPKDAWNYLKLNFKTGTALFRGVDSYFNVQISRSVILDDKWENGQTLREAIDLLEAYEKVYRDTNLEDEASITSSENQLLSNSWDCIEAGIYTIGDLFIWVQHPDAGSWINLSELFDGQDPDFEVVSLDKSTIRFLNYTKPVRCVVSRVKEIPLGGSVGTIKSKEDATKKIKFRQDLEKLYLERLGSLLESDFPSPTREEDEKWAMGLGYSRERGREVRKNNLPEEWTKPGRRPQ